MEIADRRVKRGRKSPKVPIKTYHWEDIKRSRRRGGYPWTHLYKEPFYEHLDPEPWTMDGMRKAKSSSTMGKSDDYSISEVSTFDNRSSIEEILDNPSINVKDKSHSIKTSCSSLNLEEQEIEDDIERTYEVIDKDEEEIQSPGMFFLHSEESSDDISQYLDKEERIPTETPKKSEDRLNPEEESSERKRKLSAESSNSKLSLGKKAILQKLKDTKDKIKIPKISFPTKLKKPVPKKAKNSPTQVKKTIEKPLSYPSPKDVKPVYIHIPLKPPPNETDEFSHLENEPIDEPSPSRKTASFRDLVKNIKHLQEPQIEHKHPSPIRELIEDEPEDNSHHKEIVEDTVKPLTSDDQPIIEEVLNLEEDTGEEPDEIMEIVEVIEEPQQVTETKDKTEPETPDSPPIDNEYFDKLFEASTSRERTDSQNKGRKVRSKSAEPERKRKISLESSYSRKSLSKLGILKKLRDAKDKIKNTLSRATSKKDVKVKEEPVEKPIEKPKLQLKPQKHVEPVYIHIPLKPPEGATDEYSHLEYESKPIEKVEAETISSTPEDVEPPTNGDVQLIILTAPSDDEILDDNSSDVPETPVSESKIFFPIKVNELKKIAKDAVEEVTNGSTHTLSPVSEELSPKSSLEDIAKKAIEEEKKVEHMTVDEEDGLSEAKKHKTVIEEVKVAVAKVAEEIYKKNDESKKEEDKLEEPATVEVKIEEKTEAVIEESPKATSEEIQEISEEKTELKSVLKTPNSPVMKKKVSFKRKSKNKKDSNEDQPTGSETERDDAKSMEKIEAIAVIADEISKGTSEEKSDEKWSKISDHDSDHEPVHLPSPNNIEIPTFTLNNTPAVVISTEQALGTQDQDNYNLSTKHVYEEISEGSQKKSPKTQRVVFSATTDSRSSEISEKRKEGPSKFQAAFKQKADNLKSKFQNMKRPHISLPERPKFQKPNLQRFKIEKPKWNMPKIPDTAKINLPSFSLSRKKGGKKPVKRISSTESNSGDSKKIMFDFGTYPRIFKKKSKPDITSDFATVPRSKKTTNSSKSTEDSRKSATDSIRIPLHSDESVEKEEFSLPADSSDLGESSHIRYDEGIDSEDEFDKENREVMEERDFLSRWQRGRFNPDEFMEKKKQPRVTDLDSPSEDKEFSSNNGRDQHYSSGSSVGVGIHRQGVIEEINPDEFFLRQKGISQDNIEVGMYLSTEIREAFRNPTNALVQMEGNNFDKGSHQSLPDMQSKRKPIKKPKRKKTPHASQERIPYGEEETADEELDIPPPSRPKRRSKRKKKINEEFIPYQETIQVEGEEGEDRLSQHRESLGVLGDDEQDFMYENERMEGIEHPEIKISNPYKDYGEEEEEEVEEEEEIYIPEAPPRLKPKNIKSLRTFEAGSAIQSFDVVSTIPSNARVPERISYHTKEREITKEFEPEQPKSYEMNITEPEIGYLEDQRYFEEDINKDFNNYRYMDESIEDLPPPAPPRKQKSLKSLTISENESLTGDLSANRAIFSSEKNLEEPQIDAIRTESKIIIPIDTELPPARPTRSRSRGNSKSRTGSRAASESRPTSQQDNDSISLRADSLAAETPVPCVEEPCTQTVCDYMGYTTVDRNKPRDPPLPPPRTLQRKKRSKKGQENNFFTVPRTKAQEENDTPVRPLRIYSTIGPSQKSETENKENLDIDILQYIEQDECRDLQSGDVIEKIKARPLPTPPRPPRKLRPLSDITSRENIMTDSIEDVKKASTGETEVYTQTEPLPDDFVCEEVVQEPTDRVIIPTQSAEKPRVKRELITPTVFTHEETITHGTLIVEPLNGAKILPDHEFTERPKETYIPVHVDSDNEETSSIPEEFHKLSNPKQQKPFVLPEMEVLKAHKLQVIDLDVDTLTVNKLLAEKIVVSEIDSSSIQTNEISSKTGALKIGEISLPPEVLDQIIRSIQSSHALEEQEKQKEGLGEQKKTPIQPSPVVELVPEQNLEETSEEGRISDVSIPETVFVEEISKVVPAISSEEVPLNLELPESSPEISSRILNESVESLHDQEFPQDQEPPHRPPRQVKPSQSTTEISVQEPEVDDEPPPRPPHPPLGYIPSQPPQSFYALRAQKFVDENIPAVPRRRRHTKSKQLTRSSSEESSELTPVVRRHRRRSSEPSIAQLSGQLVRACGSEANNALKRLITYILNNVFHNEDGKQDLNVMIIIVLVLIAGLLLLGYGEERTVVHLHHWEYFNPPKDL